MKIKKDLYEVILKYVEDNSGVYSLNYPDVACFIIDNKDNLSLLINLFDEDKQ